MSASFRVRFEGQGRRVSVGDGRGTVYVVATPIGNLDDLSPRAQQVLREVELIACEDTRHTAVLCQRFGIATPRVSLHAHNEAKRVPELLASSRAAARSRSSPTPDAARLGSRRAPGARRARRRRGGRAGARAVGAARGARRERLRDPTVRVRRLPSAQGRRARRALAALAAFPERSCSSRRRTARRRPWPTSAVLGPRRAAARARADQAPRDARSAGALGEVELDDPRGELTIVVEGPDPAAQSTTRRPGRPRRRSAPPARRRPLAARRRARARRALRDPAPRGVRPGARARPHAGAARDRTTRAPLPRRARAASSSSITRTSSSRAFSSFEPAFSPASR